MKKRFITVLFVLFFTSVFNNLANAEVVFCYCLNNNIPSGVCLPDGDNGSECYPVSVWGDCSDIRCNFRHVER
jgi:hypothetical protein